MRRSWIGKQREPSKGVTSGQIPERVMKYNYELALWGVNYTAVCPDFRSRSWAFVFSAWQTLSWQWLCRDINSQALTAVCFCGQSSSRLVLQQVLQAQAGEAKTYGRWEMGGQER